MIDAGLEPTFEEIMRVSPSWGGGGRGSRPPSLKNDKAIWFLSNAGPGPLKNHQNTKQLAFMINVGPSSANQRNVIKWRFACGPIMARL